MFQLREGSRSRGKRCACDRHAEMDLQLLRELEPVRDRVPKGNEIARGKPGNIGPVVKPSGTTSPARGCSVRRHPTVKPLAHTGYSQQEEEGRQPCRRRSRSIVAPWARRRAEGCWPNQGWSRCISANSPDRRLFRAIRSLMSLMMERQEGRPWCSMADQLVTTWTTKPSFLR